MDCNLEQLLFTLLNTTFLLFITLVRYIVWQDFPRAGFGNRMVGLVSAFLVAALTKRGFMSTGVYISHLH